MQRVILRQGREKSILRRHPWIFSGAVASEPEGASPGDIVEVVDGKGTLLGFGAISPKSQIRVRMLSFDPRRRPDVAFVESLVAESVARRGEMAHDSCRLVNAENDGIPGLVADKYADWICCQFTSALAERWKVEIARALAASVPGVKGIVARNDADVRRKEGLAVSGELETLFGAPPPPFVEIEEEGARLLVDIYKGHKTGFYLDQRDARRVAASYATGRSVLNCFCYTGLFGIRAALAGAGRVVQVDSSADALALARRNAELNFMPEQAEALFEYVEADVFKFLRKCRDEGRTFDMIILDPPKFAETRSQVMKAARGYKDINLLAMKLLTPGGFLATFSCSGAMDEALFDTILAEAAADAGRDFQVVSKTAQPPDHPVAISFPEGAYLKGRLLLGVAHLP